MKDIMLTCTCPSCGDTFEVTNEVYGTLSQKEWWSTYKVCLSCGSNYLPLVHWHNMFAFVFNALKRCKM